MARWFRFACWQVRARGVSVRQAAAAQAGGGDAGGVAEAGGGGAWWARAPPLCAPLAAVFTAGLKRTSTQGDGDAAKRARRDVAAAEAAAEAEAAHPLPQEHAEDWPLPQLEEDEIDMSPREEKEEARVVSTPPREVSPAREAHGAASVRQALAAAGDGDGDEGEGEAAAESDAGGRLLSERTRRVKMFLRRVLPPAATTAARVRSPPPPASLSALWVQAVVCMGLLVVRTVTSALHRVTTVVRMERGIDAERSKGRGGGSRLCSRAAAAGGSSTVTQNARRRGSSSSACCSTTRASSRSTSESRSGNCFCRQPPHSHYKRVAAQL
jgi:hypothetical protein